MSRGERISCVVLVLVGVPSPPVIYASGISDVVSV